MCENGAVCRSVFLDYKCECLTESYTGRHCETITTSLMIRQTVSKSIGYIAILALVITASFIFVLDISKYCFGIDPVRKEREHLRKIKQMKKRKPIIQRFTYVNAQCDKKTSFELQTFGTIYSNIRS